MLPGMYVTHQGVVCQVRQISGDQPAYPGGPSHTTYTLQPLCGTELRWVDNPQAVDVPLTPACDQCGCAAGHGACAVTGCHPEVPAVPQHVERERDDGCHCGACPDCWQYLHGHARPLC